MDLAIEHLLAGNDVSDILSMIKTGPPKLTKWSAGNPLRLAERDNEDWLDDEESLTFHEKALLDTRLAAYANDPNAGSTWEEVESRIRDRLSGQTDEPSSNCQARRGGCNH